MGVHLSNRVQLSPCLMEAPANFMNDDFYETPRKQHTHTHIHTYIHTYIHTCMHTYISTYMHATTHTHTHTHTHTLTFSIKNDVSTKS